MPRLRRLQTGFTLIEMLVVIAIISILIGIGVNTFTIAQKKARDVRRKADIRNIQTALEIYSQDKGGFPWAGLYGLSWNWFVPASAVSTQLVPTYLPIMPADPLPNGGTSGMPFSSSTYTDYLYRADGLCTIVGAGNTDSYTDNYALAARLENLNDPDDITRKPITCITDGGFGSTVGWYVVVGHK